MILWQMLMHKQWKLALLSIVCTPVWLAPIFWGGYLVALIIGWQENSKWKINKIMIAYSLLVPVCFILALQNVIKEATAPPPVVQAKKGAIRVAPSAPAK
jgi:hypothetical protein